MNGWPLGLPEVTAGLMLLALNAYVLTGGADFGGGVWDLLAGGPRRARQRTVIAGAIAPIWEANHVWLILAVVICLTAFPAAYAELGTVLHIPLTLVLVGIVCRGSAFVFRSSQHGTTRIGGPWAGIFAVASTITPLFLGMMVAAVVSGSVGRAGEAAAGATFFEVFVAPWISPFTIAAGFLTLALFALLAATYLTIAAPDAELRDDFRARALVAEAAVLLLAPLAWVLAPPETSIFRDGPLAGSGSVVLVIGTALSAGLGIWSLWRRRFREARVAVGAQASLILWGWAAAQHPYLVPRTLTIRAAAAPDRTLVVLLSALGAGALILIPSLAYLLRLFATREVRQDDAGRPLR